MPEAQTGFIRGPHAPLSIERAEGAYLYTTDGRKVLDAGAGAIVVNIGQGRAEVADVTRDAVARLNYIIPPWTSPERARLEQRLKNWTPGNLKRFCFASGGSESVELALKFALLYQRVKGRPSKKKIIGRRTSYHGNTLAALSVGYTPRRLDYQEVLFDWPKIGPSYCYRCEWGKTYPGCDIDCASALEAEIKRQGPDTVAAFICEPMIGGAAAVVPPVREYWPRLREICSKYEVLLIDDEVMTGFGRTGRKFAVEHWNVVPDILVGGKGLTGGYMPMGMIAVAENLVEEVEHAGKEFMFYTYSAHTAACAVADKVLEIIERERLVERAAEVGARLGAHLKEELSGHPLVGDIRGTGMFWGIELVRDKKTRAPHPPDKRVTGHAVAAALHQGIFVYPAIAGMAGAAGGDGFLICPPFIIGDREIELIVRGLRGALDDVQARL